MGKRFFAGVVLVCCALSPAVGLSLAVNGEDLADAVARLGIAAVPGVR